MKDARCPKLALTRQSHELDALDGLLRALLGSIRALLGRRDRPRSRADRS